jgi:hypothetical protein
MAETKPTETQTPAKPVQDSNNDRLAAVLEKFLEKDTKQALTPNEDLFVAKVPNGIFKIPNRLGTGFTLQNCHGDIVDDKGRILTESDVEGTRAMADA